MDNTEIDSAASLPTPVTSHPKRWMQKFQDDCKFAYKQCTTKQGLIGDLDYGYLFTPKIPFVGKTGTPPRFFGLNEQVPVVMATLLGLQHALAMMGGLVAAVLLYSSMANLEIRDSQYLVSASLISAGILSFVQIKSFKVPFTSYRIGSGTLSVLGTAFSTVPVFGTAIPIMYKTGFCPSAEDGTRLPCPDAYGAFLGTSALCSLFLVLMSFTPQKIILKVFPRIVNGPVVLLIGTSLIQSGMKDWAGGSGCMKPGQLCPSASAPHAHPWGSGQFIGLGFSVFIAIIICEKWGPPFFKSCSVIIGLLVGCIIAAGCGYFSHKSIDAAPSGEFLWVRTFKLQLYGPIVLPLLAVMIVIAMETIGDITATCEVSRLTTDGLEFDARVQGGLIATGLGNIAANLMTLMPQASFAQNNGVIAMTQCASRVAGYFACLWLIIMGVIGKFSAAIVAIPKAVIGGMTTFLFTSVALSGLCLIANCKFTRRDRLVLTISLMWGFASLLVPNWFSGVFTYKGSNTALQGFLDAINIVIETPYAIGGIAGVIANLVFPECDDDLPQVVENARDLGDVEEFSGVEPSIDADDSLTRKEL